jgi:hypothetical protein
MRHAPIPLRATLAPARLPHLILIYAYSKTTLVIELISQNIPTFIQTLLHEADNHLLAEREFISTDVRQLLENDEFLINLHC